MLGYRGRKTYRVNRWATSSNDPEQPEDRTEEEGASANAVSSEALRIRSAEVPGGWHRPVLDLDFPHHYEPSSTPGHGHLYLDTAIPWERCVQLLDILVDCKVIEPGYAAASKQRGAMFARLPWIKKEQ